MTRRAPSLSPRPMASGPWLLLLVCLHVHPSRCQEDAPCAFNTMCSCKMAAANTSHVSCLGVPLLTFPELPGGEVALVDIVDSGLEALESEALGDARIESLRLMSNRLEFVGNRAFSSSVSVLKSLDLSYNQLSEVPFESLQHLQALDWLSLHSNQIATLQGQAESSWGRLKDTLTNVYLGDNDLTELPRSTQPHENIEAPSRRDGSLTKNRLSSIHERSFEGLELSLEYITLEDNELQEIPTALGRLKRLKYFYIASNNISDIQSDVFQKLEYLNLESNRLVELPPDMFRTSTFVKLRDIRLSYNLLSVIESRTFSSLPNLQTLVLTGNRIKTIKSSGFHNVTRLSTIILSDNQLVSIEDKAFYDLPNLGRLDMQNNKLEYFTLNIFERVATELVPFRINVSRNMITYLYSTRNFSMLSVTVFDVTHNKVFDIPDDYFYKFNKTLRQLYMGHNNIRQLRSETFGSLTSVECLTLEHNHISSIHKSTFHALASLQVLDLSHNHVRQLQARQLAGLGRLRVVRLSHNQLRALPRDVFAGSPLERLDLSGNKFAALPAGALGAAGRTLRQLRMADNAVERVDGTALFDTPRLLELDLARNGLASLPDNLLAGVAGLQRLDLSGNRLRANFRELFHFAQRLRHLRAAGMGLAAMLPLPLPALLSLDVSDNLIAEVSPAAVGRLASLRTLSLRNNRLTSVPAHAWVHTPLLKSLDISGNPLKSMMGTARSMLPVDGLMGTARSMLPVDGLMDTARSMLPVDGLVGTARSMLPVDSLMGTARSMLPVDGLMGTARSMLPVDGLSLTKDSFSGLSRLQHLDIQRLATLQRLDAGTLAGLPRLWSVRLEARPGLGAAQALARAPSLGSVAVEVSGRELGDQLQGAFHRRLCRLHVTGPDLAAVRPGALRDLGDRHELELRFRGTRLDSLPAGLVASLRRVGQLTLDIGGNQFSSLSPASLYANGTDWENIGTRLVAGGLVVKDNPWVCDCDLVWLGQWLRRWLRETAQVHTMALDDAHLAQLRVREAICRDKISGKATAIVDLYPEVLRCHASALSQGGASSHCSCGRDVQCFVFLLLVEVSRMRCC
ncbi:chaoptin-like [Bacillus rossius redtenbacheri]|uniref:chaoptin-like n=1 Tax=Bacillus rossius redtenbacheri TaxID=93214 RepID=UPI002FDDF654